MRVEFLGRELTSPLFVPSGIWPLSEDSDFLNQIDKESIGFVILKTITLNPRQGNAGIRIYESPCGMMNSIGLANPGLDGFVSEYKEYIPDREHIISVMPLSLDEFEVFADKLNPLNLWAIEVNLSCPNVSHGVDKALIAQSPSLSFEFIKKAKSVFECPVIAKLSPDVTDIVEIAYACQQAGADALDLVNTFSGLRIDIFLARPVFDRGFAGVSGPAVLPLSLRRIWEVRASGKITVPILGSGGVYDSYSALEMAMAGADVVGVGSAFLKTPMEISALNQGLRDFLNENNLSWRDVVARSIRRK